MKFFSILTWATCLTAVTSKQVTGNSGVSYCKGDGSNYKLQLSDVDITPNPPVKYILPSPFPQSIQLTTSPHRGQSITITAQGHSRAPLRKGVYMEMKFKKSIISKKLRQPLCEGPKGCADRDMTIEFEKEVPKKAPGGEYGVEVRIKRDNGEELTCVKGKVKL